MEVIKGRLEISFLTAFRRCDGGQRDDHGAVEQVAVTDVVVDARDHERPGLGEDLFLSIRVESTGSESTSGCNTTKGIAQPLRQRGDIVEGHDLSGTRCMTRSRSSLTEPRRGIIETGIDHCTHSMRAAADVA